MLIAFLGAAVGVHENTHPAVTFLRTSVPARIKTVLAIATDLVLAGFGALMLWYGAQLTLYADVLSRAGQNDRSAYWDHG